MHTSVEPTELNNRADSPAFKNADTENEGKEKFVLLEERSTNVAVDAASEVLVENLTAFRQYVTLLTDEDRLMTIHNTSSLVFPRKLRLLVCANY